LELVNREIGRPTDAVGVFSTDRALLRLAASVVIGRDDEWLVGKRSCQSTYSDRARSRTDDLADELHPVLGLD
jgi:hypothetical protein